MISSESPKARIDSIPDNCFPYQPSAGSIQGIEGCLALAVSNWLAAGSLADW